MSFQPDNRSGRSLDVKPRHRSQVTGLKISLQFKKLIIEPFHKCSTTDLGISLGNWMWEKGGRRDLLSACRLRGFLAGMTSWLTKVFLLELEAIIE